MRDPGELPVYEKDGAAPKERFRTFSVDAAETTAAEESFSAKYAVGPRVGCKISCSTVFASTVTAMFLTGAELNLGCKPVTQ